MKSVTGFQLQLIPSLILLLTACTGNLKTASSDDIQQLTRLETDQGANRLVWFAPELENRRFRDLFYGYDTVYYLLKAETDTTLSPGISYHLLIDANYGSVLPRHYQQTDLGNGQTHPLEHLRHETLRCQFFGNMTNACLFRDRADTELSLATLEAGRLSGLSIVLTSADKAYETLEIPANYINGFLQAVQALKN